MSDYTDFTEVVYRVHGMVITVFPRHNRINLSLRDGFQTTTMSIDDLVRVIERIQKEREGVRDADGSH